MTQEGQTLRIITDWLSAERIWHMRINTGAMAGTHNGKKRFVRFAKPGTADIFCTPKLLKDDWGVTHCVPMWIEVKTAKGKQSEAQVLFQNEVEAEGHIYVVARSIEDVQSALKEHSL